MDIGKGNVECNMQRWISGLTRNNMNVNIAYLPWCQPETYFICSSIVFDNRTIYV